MALLLTPCALQAEESPAQVYFYHALKSKQEAVLLQEFLARRAQTGSETASETKSS